MSEFHELVNVQALKDEAELELQRSRALVSAIRRNRDCLLVGLVKPVEPNKPKLEGIVVDIETDGVPPNGSVGIEYRERIVLWVPENPKDQVTVIALRKNFPVTIHQNQGVAGEPANLCLYFESTASVLRTWTPQNFLRRIQWWIEKTSRNELHATDQALEQLFFTTNYQLVLPWNHEEVRNNTSLRAVVHCREERRDTGQSFFLDYVPVESSESVSACTLFQFELPPVVHGFVELAPNTLGSLVDSLSKRNVDLIETLRMAITQKLDRKGVSVKNDEQLAIVLLRIPICREIGSPIEKFSHHAYFLGRGILKLGVELGVCFEHEEKYYDSVGVLDENKSNDWRGKFIWALEILQKNSAASARKQSGIEDSGPDAVLIGVGSLGSAILNLWGRSGWGNWTVVDNDFVKPHNISRHVAYQQHIGQMKANVVAELHDAAMNGASAVKPIVADAYNNKEAVNSALKTNSLVVDATTTLEYPRLASTVDLYARHISVFITPSGNAAVLLAEDTKRELRLRTLEAQYYRAIIHSDWGKHHLNDTSKTFLSGASCRDISVVLPYSRILNHASTLAEQIQIASHQDNSVIRIWHRDPDTAAVTAHIVETFPERRIELGNIDLYIDAGVEQRLRNMRTESHPNETGGILLGYYDFNVNSVIVVDALSAPPDSVKSPIAFERGTSGLEEAVNEASRRTTGNVGYIGEWHSHPPGHSAAPSRDDVMQLIHVALGMAEDGLPGVQLIVGEHDIHVLQGSIVG